MANQRILFGVGSEASLVQQSSPQSQYGEALKQWETTLPNLTGDERFDTLLSMATAYQALGRVEKAFNLLKRRKPWPNALRIRHAMP
jgi:hypothetical protein